MTCRIENGQLSDRYRIATDTGCIVSNQSYRLLLYRGKPTLRASLQIPHLISETNCITQDDGRTFAPRHLRARPPHDKGGGCRGGRCKETVTWYQPPRDTKTTLYWVLATSDRWRFTSRKWYQQSTVNHSNVSANYPVLKLTERESWFVANGLHVPPIAYKQRSLNHLPGLILQVAGTPTQGVLVSDGIGAFPYRPFSSAEQTLVILAKTPA